MQCIETAGVFLSNTNSKLFSMFPVVHFSFSCTNGFQGPYKSVLKRVSWWKNHSSMQSKESAPSPQCHRSTMSYCGLFPCTVNGSNLLSLATSRQTFWSHFRHKFEFCFALHSSCGKYLRKKGNYFFNFAISHYPLVDMDHLFALCIFHTHPIIQGMTQWE